MLKIGTHEFEVKDGLISFTPEELEDFLDELAFDEAMARNEESYPADLVYRLLEGENPIKIFRTHRNMTQTELGKAVGVSQPQIADIESGKKDGSIKVIKAIAETLRVDIDQII